MRISDWSSDVCSSDLKCDQINGELDALASIHLDTPPPHTPPTFLPQPYTQSVPPLPMPPRPRWWEKLLAKRLAKLEAIHQHAVAEHQRQLAEWEKAKALHEHNQYQQRHLIEHEIHPDTTAMERWLKEKLQDIAWPRDTR